MFIEDMDMSRLIAYVQRVEDVKLKDKKEFLNKKANTRNESGH